MSKEEVVKMYRVMRTTCDMLSERGYFLNPDRVPTSSSDFEAKYCAVTTGAAPIVMKKDMTLQCERIADAADILIAFFVDDKKVSANHVRDFNAVARSQNAKVMIIVYPEMVTPIARRAIAQVNNMDEIRIEPFSEDELMVNITKHELVPPHIPLSLEEKKDMLRTFRLKESQLPRMSSADPVARHYGLARGRVVKIKRPSETAGEYVTYRLVV